MVKEQVNISLVAKSSHKVAVVKVKSVMLIMPLQWLMKRKTRFSVVAQ